MGCPRLTIIVPSFNQPQKILKESLDSIIRQTFQDYECIVIDESTDSELADICKQTCSIDSRFKYYHPIHKLGLAGSLNYGLDIARSEWVARFDSDDICIKTRFEDQMAFLDRNHDVDVLGGGLEIINESGETIAYRDYPEKHRDIERKMQFTTPIAHPTVIYRRKKVLMAGGYNPSFRFAEDLDLWLRLINAGAKFANLKKTLVSYRQQNTNRQQRHWIFNLRARINNLSARYFFRRIAGVAAIAIWSILPQTIQEKMYKSLQLRQ
jgi:glycosyltransferase involved in cell wall biosynthesis